MDVENIKLNNSIHNSSSLSLLESESDEVQPQKKEPQEKQEKRKVTRIRPQDLKKSDRLRYVQHFLVVVSIILFVAVIIFIALAMARVMQPMIALYAFCGSAVLFITTLIIEGRIRKYLKNNENYENYYGQRQPMPTRHTKLKKKENN